MALLWENHEHHQVARPWFRQITNFSTCPVTQLGFARVSSHPALGYSMSPDQAFSVLRRFLADGRHRFVSDDLSCADRVLRTDLMRNANQVGSSSGGRLKSLMSTSSNSASLHACAIS